MKKIIYVVFILIAIGFISCQEKVDNGAEKEAIMKVIQNESEFARDGNVEGLTSLYIQDEYNTRLTLREDSITILTGWKDLGPLFESLKEYEGGELSGISISKENALVKVTGKTAWIICDNIWKGVYEEEDLKYESTQITFLEKVDGEWKISFAGWLVKPEPKEEGPEEE